MLLWHGVGVFDSVFVVFYFFVILCVPQVGKKYWLMNKTRSIALFPTAPCIESHCQGEQSAESMQTCESVGEKWRRKTFPV